MPDPLNDIFNEINDHFTKSKSCNVNKTIREGERDSARELERAKEKYKKGKDFVELIRKLGAIAHRMDMMYSEEEMTQKHMMENAEEARDTAIELVDSIRDSYSLSEAYHIRSLTDSMDFFKKKYKELKTPTERE